MDATYQILEQKGLRLILIDHDHFQQMSLQELQPLLRDTKAEQEIKDLQTNPQHVISPMGERTDHEILVQTNELALRILGANGMEQTPENVEKWVCNIHHPSARAAWNTACVAQQIITATDPNDCLYVLDEDGADADQ